MIITKKYIRDLREKSLMRISYKAEKIMLKELDHEPGPDDEGNFHLYTEQDLCEQVRKIIRDNP